LFFLKENCFLIKIVPIYNTLAILKYIQRPLSLQPSCPSGSVSALERSLAIRRLLVSTLVLLFTKKLVLSFTKTLVPLFTICKASPTIQLKAGAACHLKIVLKVM
jgi:hypothetical protein